MKAAMDLVRSGTVVPVWARMEYICAISGLPHFSVRRLVNEGKVRAVKVDPERPGSSVVFRVQDVLDWMEEEAPAPKGFVVPEHMRGELPVRGGGE